MNECKERMGRNYTVTIEIPALDRALAYLEGRAAKEIQKKIDEAVNIIGKTSSDTQADLANASKS